MMKKWRRRLLRLTCIAAILGAGTLLWQTLHQPDAPVPGLTGDERVLLRIWTVDSPGGASSWLTGQLRQWEKQHPGVTTYVRQVSSDMLTEEDAVLPDIVLYAPGDVASPEGLFMPLSGGAADRDGLLREELLRCGRYRNVQYGLPLCWGAWVLAINSSLEPGSAATPAPTTLLGKPVATDQADATPTPGYPLPAASRADCALQSPAGTALFTLGTLLDDMARPPLPEGFAQSPSGEVYSGFLRQAWATAMLTTGQLTALTSLASSGGAFPFRALTAQDVITDQVWLASVTPDAPKEAALLLAHLTSAPAQEALSAQGLFPVRADMALYAAGTAGLVEAASRHGLAAINAYVPDADVQSAAWRFWQGTATLDEALLPLL